MNNTDKAYIELCRDILANGNIKGDRTGTGTISDFGKQMTFDLSEGFPLLTTKAVHFKSVVGELLFFLSGATNIAFLKKHNIKIWDKFATPDGYIGRMYGSKWRDYKTRTWVGGNFESIDQIAGLIKLIKNTPDSRRMIINAWDVSDQPTPLLSPSENVRQGNPALPPCHVLFQCYVANGKLSLQFYQRSADMFLGVPFNIASYALLTHMLAQVCGLEVGKLIWSGGDCHIYSNHVEQVKKQIARFDNGEVYELPQIKLNPAIDDIDDFTFDDIELIGYQSGAAIKGSVAV